MSEGGGWVREAVVVSLVRAHRLRRPIRWSVAQLVASVVLPLAVEGGRLASAAAVQLAAQMCLDKLRTARPGGRERWRDEQLGPVEPARVRGMVGESAASFIDWLMSLR